MSAKTINGLLLFTIICISLSAIFVRLSDAPSTVMVMYRMLLGSMLIIPFVFKERHSFTKISGMDWLRLSFAGLFLAGHFGLWFESLNHTTVASSTLILCLQPAIALIGGLLFFKERIHKSTIVTLSIAFIGVIIVAGGNVNLGPGVMYGNLLSFLSVFSVVLYLLIGQRTVKSVNHWVYSFIVFMFAALFMVGFNLVQNVPFTGYTSHDWLIFLLLAIFPTGAHLIYNLLLNYVNTTTVSISTLGEPIGASTLAAIFLGEMFTTVELIGGVLIITGIYLFLRSQSSMYKIKEPS
ncbi:DMT family transporter [Geomicrobium sp. JCM 19039]|uniref:DMT family transporter n=1 Tax=Geomicrobium sp. JCM 19039 TaxID=1460636 RepID=UPI00045F1B5B|nr:DMT family transporter [Geomicrobium sp. JCM 19039]GAK13373.1 hypothetical protein JCM19039_3216 [Geomicrobium sp. JCM 19039]